MPLRTRAGRSASPPCSKPWRAARAEQTQRGKREAAQQARRAGRREQQAQREWVGRAWVTAPVRWSQWTRRDGRHCSSQRQRAQRRAHSRHYGSAQTLDRETRAGAAACNSRRRAGTQSASRCFYLSRGQRCAHALFRSRGGGGGARGGGGTGRGAGGRTAPAPAPSWSTGRRAAAAPAPAPAATPAPAPSWSAGRCTAAAAAAAAAPASAPAAAAGGQSSRGWLGERERQLRGARDISLRLRGCKSGSRRHRARAAAARNAIRAPSISRTPFFARTDARTGRARACG
ncbi:hypothetical protein T492DRAFT_416722 [Pavlovales sp. CCMP2436]|nr:hypothetical protein T492DRAFT_416722 [Pavlovales sp. CCMP2436]